MGYWEMKELLEWGPMPESDEDPAAYRAEKFAGEGENPENLEETA